MGLLRKSSTGRKIHAGDTMRKPIALACSDLHFHDWPQFNEDQKRLKVAASFLSAITFSAEQMQVPILFPGDLFQNPKGVNNEVYDFFNPLFRKLDDRNKVHIYGVGGNHDMSEKNTKEKRSPSLFLGACKAFPNLFKSVEFSRVETKRINIMGIPYITHNVGFAELVEEAKEGIREGFPNILLVHCDLWGAKDPSGRETNTVENIPRNLGKFFRGFDLVLAGHIHQHAKLWDGVYMVGAPYQQRKSDMGCKMGYLIVYDDLSIEFKRYPAPEFKTYNREEGHPDTHDYWIPIDLPKKREKQVEGGFSAKASKKSLAKQYLRAMGIDNPSKANALINILQKTDD